MKKGRAARRGSAFRRKASTPKPKSAFAGCDSIPSLFAFAFQRAISLLGGEDLANLSRAPTGAIGLLHWLSDTEARDLSVAMDAWSNRDPGRRYAVRSEERGRLVAVLGAGALDDGRRMFCLAHAIDVHFTRFADDAPRLRSKVVSPAPTAFFGDIPNAPPPIGRMTSIAVCRRWFRHFAYVGDVEAVTGFGRMPTPVCRRLSARAAQTLEGAREDGELRIALVTWRESDQARLSWLAAAPGCFAIGGRVNPPRSATLVEELLRLLHRQRVHVALLPELALDDGELAAMKASLKARASRFPGLVAAGLAHRRVGEAHENVAVLLDARGDEVMRHEKLEPFTTSAGAIEDIVPRRSASYDFVDTPVGRLVLNVCRDFRSDVPMFLNRLLAATLVLVPAYSKKLDFALEEARILGARHNAIVAAVNPTTADVAHAAALYAPVLRYPGCAVAQATVAPLVAGRDLAVLNFRLRIGAGGHGFVDLEPLGVV